jgi:hypothetical protein
MPEPASIDSTPRALARHPFRACFHLRGREAATDEQAYAVDVTRRWIEQDLVAAGRRAPG